MGYFFVHERYQAVYIDNRLFYIINILCLLCLFLANLLLLRLTKKFKFIGAGILSIFIIVNIVLLVESNAKVTNITSVSPDYKHVFSIKENVASGEAVYYRSYYGIFGRPQEILPNEIVGEYEVEWLANDIAAFTYRSAENTINQFIGTYGDRKAGLSYYYVGAEIQGVWRGENIEVISSPEGISVSENKKMELFTWDNIEQFGTLAVVLKKDNEAVWTISLNDNFEVQSDDTTPIVGNISLYKPTMGKHQPVILHYKSLN